MCWVNNSSAVHISDLTNMDFIIQKVSYNLSQDGQSFMNWTSHNFYFFYLSSETLMILPGRVSASPDTCISLAMTFAHHSPSRV